MELNNDICRTNFFLLLVPDHPGPRKLKISQVDVGNLMGCSQFLLSSSGEEFEHVGVNGGNRMKHDFVSFNC